MYKILTLNYLLNGAVYNDNTVHSFDNENLATNITITVPDDYEDFSFVMDCQNGTVTKQYSLGSGATTYSISLDDSLTLAGTLELQLWATILSGEETIKVQWQKFNVTIDDALNISTITAEDNPDIIATHTSQLAYLMGIITDTGDGTQFLSDDGIYKSTGAITNYEDLTNKPQINSFELIGNKTGAELRLGEELHYKIRAAGTISIGDPLQIAGIGTDYLDAIKDQSSSAIPQYFIGIASSSLSSGEYGTAVWNGRLDGVDTSAWNEGDTLYLNYSTHNLTNTRVGHSDSVDLIRVGIVLVKGISGSIGVRPELYTRLNNLSNVHITSQTDGQLLTSSGNGWINANKPTYTAAEVGAVALTGDTMTGELNLSGTGIGITDYVDLNTAETPELVAGRIQWNNLENCVEVDNLSGETLVSQNIGQTLWIRVRNISGATIPIGKAVYTTGGIGNVPTVALAQSNSLATSLTYIGLTVSDIPNNSNGYVVRVGYVNGVNTNAWNVGQILYLSSTNAGELVATKPLAPNLHIIVGAVRVKSGSGSIAILGDSFPIMRALSDVYIPAATPNNGDVLKYNLSNLRWEQYSTDNYKTYAGFVNRTDSTISINSGTGVFTLAPAVTSFTVYVNNEKRTLSSTQTVTVTDDQTITYIYLDSTGTLQKSLSAFDFTSISNIPVAIVFKDGSTYALTDERHGYERNMAWHNWAHNNIGVMYKSGLTGTFATSTLSVAQGVIYDEDIRFDTGGTKTSTTLWYRNATSGMRMVRNATACKSVSGGGILQYDNGSGTLQEVSLNSYTTNWVYASNDPTEPIYTVVGQNNSTTLTLARNTPAPTINLSTSEWKLIYRVIYQRTAGTQAGVYVEATDYRSVQTGVPVTAVFTDHSTLINRDAANSHPASAVSYDIGSGLTSVQYEINRILTYLGI